MITGETSKAAKKRIEDELASTNEPSFKFLFVTPEKIAKAKRFVARIEKLYNNSRLDRIVIGTAPGFVCTDKLRRVSLLFKLGSRLPTGLLAARDFTHSVSKDADSCLHSYGNQEGARRCYQDIGDAQYASVPVEL